MRSYFPPDEQKTIRRSSIVLKRCLLLFWAVWLSMVFATNALDCCKVFGLLGDDWKFASGNYGFLTETTARYGTPTWLNQLMFLSVIGWEGIAAIMFWLVFFRFRSSEETSRSLLYAAFTVGLGLWSAFAIADEFFIAYPVEGTHLRLFIAQLATLLTIELLPEKVQE